jgi:hypothetical protein
MVVGVTSRLHSQPGPSADGGWSAFPPGGYKGCQALAEKWDTFFYALRVGRDSAKSHPSASAQGRLSKTTSTWGTPANCEFPDLTAQTSVSKLRPQTTYQR